VELTGILQKAKNQQLHYDHRATAMYRNEVVTEASTRLGTERFRPWRSNYMADLFSAPGSESQVLLKLVVGKPSEAVDAQFLALGELNGLARRSEGFRVPTPVLNLDGRSAYVMEKLEGQPLTKLISEAADEATLMSFVEKCGAGLANIHREWREDLSRFPLELVEDFNSHSPWVLKDGERRTMERLRLAVASAQVKWSRLYLDFDPVNVLIDGSGVPAFVDPPDTVVSGPIHWDIGVFTLGIERSLWRRPLSMRQNRALVECLRSTFFRAYEEISGGSLSTLDMIMVDFCEAIRLAQLALWWRDYGRLRRRLKGWARSAYATPLIRSSWYRHAARIEARLGELQ
jgi:hypothetical protein